MYVPFNYWVRTHKLTIRYVEGNVLDLSSGWWIDGVLGDLCVGEIRAHVHIVDKFHGNVVVDVWDNGQCRHPYVERPVVSGGRMNRRSVKHWWDIIVYSSGVDNLNNIR